MRRPIVSTIIGLEIVALILVMLQLPGGVRTDEAKYLLSIPYPHPPVLRSVIAFTKEWAAQEFLWRFVFASAVVQSAWMIRSMSAVLPMERRLLLAVTWLTAAPVILQGGTIVLCVMTAVFGTLLVSLALRQEAIPDRWVPWLGSLWLLALFSVYQSLLFAPLVLGILLRTKVRRWHVIAVWAVPVFLLVLYSLANPLMVASMVSVGSRDGVLSFGSRITQILRVIALSGGVLTVVGLTGILKSERRDLQVTTVLILLFIAVSSQQYYAILLAPVLIAGLFIQCCRRRVPSGLFLATHALCSIVLIAVAFPSVRPGPARATARFLQSQNVHGPVLIDGPFGHEWQYESNLPIRRFSQDLSTAVEDASDVIVCTKKTCEADVDQEKWARAEGGGVEMWRKRER